MKTWQAPCGDIPIMARRLRPEDGSTLEACLDYTARTKTFYIGINRKVRDRYAVSLVSSANQTKKQL